MSFPRYPTYKDSGVEWLGQVPEHWETSAVWLLFDIGRGRVISHDEIHTNSGEYPVYSSQTENDGVMGFLNTYDFSGDYLTWTTDGAHAGTVFRRRGDFNCTNVCGTLKSKQPETSLNFFLHTIQLAGMSFVRHDINPKLMNNVMGKIKIPIPSIVEQRKIAAFLDRETGKIDELVAEQERLMELLKEKRQAVISHAVTKGLNPNAPMKPSGIDWLGDIPAHWAICAIKWKTAAITDGAHISPDTENGTIPFVSTVDIAGDEIDFENSLRTSESSYAYMVKTGCNPKRGDVLFSKDGTIGKTIIIRDSLEFAVASSLIIVRPNSELCSEFLNFALQSSLVVQQVQACVKGAGLPRLSVTNLTKIQVAFPPIKEQASIASGLAARTAEFAGLIRENRRAIDLLLERRSALISAAVTGQIDVRKFVASEAA